MALAYQPFQTYSSLAEAQPLLDVLAAHDIAATTVVDDGRLAFDPTFANNSFVTSVMVQLQPQDFERARQLQEQLNEQSARYRLAITYLVSPTTNSSTCWPSPMSGAASM